MPTPFTHLRTAQRLLNDDAIPAEVRLFLHDERGAFLLGNIAADARVDTGQTRETTHFYHYEQGIERHPWRVMFDKFPALWGASAAQKAFLAGYVAHLSMDEVWSLDMLAPEFGQRDWGASSRFRFLMLHIILIYMDERDHAALEAWQADALRSAAPDVWTPFMSDDTLRHWRDFIAVQLGPDASQTLDVLGARVNKTRDELRAILDTPERMHNDLWENVTPETLARVEDKMYTHACEQMMVYLLETDS